jgi:hypothetical protein
LEIPPAKNTALRYNKHEGMSTSKDIEIKFKYALPGIFYLLSGDLIWQVNVKCTGCKCLQHQMNWGRGLGEHGIGLTQGITPAQREETEKNHKHFRH